MPFLLVPSQTYFSLNGSLRTVKDSIMVKDFVLQFRSTLPEIQHKVLGGVRGCNLLEHRSNASLISKA